MKIILIAVTLICLSCASSPKKSDASFRQEVSAAREAEKNIDNAVHHAKFREFTVSREALKSYLERGAARFFADFEVMPVMQGSKLTAFEIGANPYPWLDVEIGHKVTAINGKLPETPAKFFELWQNAEKKDKIEFDIANGTENYKLRWKIVN